MSLSHPEVKLRHLVPSDPSVVVSVWPAAGSVASKGVIPMVDSDVWGKEKV
jgi:hypothetical protein